MQNTVGSEEFGFYFSLFNFSLLLNIILDFGITNYNNRNISQNQNILSKHVSNIIAIRLILALIYAILSISIALIIGYDPRQMKMLGMLIFNQFLLSFILYLRSNISGLQMFKTDSVISVLDRLLMIIICGIFIWGNITESSFKIEWLVIIQTISYFITALTAFFIVLRKTDFFKINFDYKFFRVFLKKSFPYALLALLMSFYNRIDSVMLERLLINGKEQTGIYAQAFRILEGASMFAYLFSVLLLPMFAKMLKKRESIKSLSNLSFLMIIVPAISVVFICIFYNNDIMSLMYKEHFDQSAKILSIIMIGFLGICTTYIFGTLLTSNGSLKYLNIMASCGMILNIILNLILIPRYQALGAAISSMTTQLFTGLSQLLIAKKVFHFKNNYKLLVLLFIFIMFSGVITYIMSRTNLTWYYSAVLSLIICLTLAFALKIFKLKDFLLILKERQESI